MLKRLLRFGVTFSVTVFELPPVFDYLGNFLVSVHSGYNVSGILISVDVSGTSAPNCLFNMDTLLTAR